MADARYPLDHTKGFVTVPRSVRDLSPLMRDHLALALWLELNLRARYEPGWVTGSHGEIWLERGQAIVGTRELAERLGVPARNKNMIRRRLEKLSRLGLISQKPDQRGTVVTVEHYDEFTGADETSGPAADQPRTSGGPAVDPNNQETKITKRTTQGSLPLSSTADPVPATRRVPAKRSRKKGTAPTRRVTDRWFELFERRYGTRPTWGKAQGAMLKRLLKQHDADEVIARAERLFDDAQRPSWIGDGDGAFDFARLVGVFDKLAVRVSQRPAVGDEFWDEAEAATHRRWERGQ